MILIVGSTGPATAQCHKTLGLPTSVLLQDESEISQGAVFHTSLADCPTLPKLIDLFDHIYWAGSNIEEFDSFDSYFSTIYFLKIHHNKFNNVVNIDDVDFYKLGPKFINIPQPSDNQAIFMGCSHTSGVGLTDMRYSYTTLVANHFNKTPLNLGMPGLGNFETFNNINKINFLNNQIVVLQLTSIARILFYADEELDTTITHLPLHYVQNKSFHKVYNDKQLMYATLDRVQNIVNYFRAKNLRFVFFNLGDSTISDESGMFKRTLEYYFSDYQEYVPELIFDYCDRGTDNLHYGPNTQQRWAEKLINRLNKLYPQ